MTKVIKKTNNNNQGLDLGKSLILVMFPPFLKPISKP